MRCLINATTVTQCDILQVLNISPVVGIPCFPYLELWHKLWDSPQNRQVLEVYLLMMVRQRVPLKQIIICTIKLYLWKYMKIHVLVRAYHHLLKKLSKRFALYLFNCSQEFQVISPWAITTEITVISNEWLNEAPQWKLKI